MLEAVQSSFRTDASQQGAQAHGANAAKSLFMGHTVQVAASPESMLADSAEELGFALDKTKDCALKDRKERESSEIGKKLLERYQVLMHKLGKTEEMNQLVEQLRRLSDRQKMREALARSFSDPADAWAALENAMETLESDPTVSAQTRAELKACAESFREENARAIKLGMQGALTGEDFPELGTPEDTKTLYRETVGEFSDVQEVFSEIKTHYGANFDKAMDFLFAALSADIDSEVPSMGRAHLESVHSKLGLVRLTQSAYTLCENVIARWQNVHAGGASLSPMELLDNLMTLSSRSFVSSVQFDSIVVKARPVDVEHEVLFLQELLSAARKFPDRLFADENRRTSFMEALQEAVDKAIDREDEYLATL